VVAGSNSVAVQFVDAGIAVALTAKSMYFISPVTDAPRVRAVEEKPFRFVLLNLFCGLLFFADADPLLVLFAMCGSLRKLIESRAHLRRARGHPAYVGCAWVARATARACLQPICLQAPLK